ELSVLQHHPLLMSIGLSILGNVRDAEDAVQETFLRWFEKDTSDVKESKPYLISTLKNYCFTNFKKGQKMEEAKEAIKSEEGISSYIPSYFSDFDMEKELSKSYEMICKKLNITETKVYMMKEVFNVDYNEISEIMDKKVENCRKILDRAKQRLEEENERFKLEMKKHKESFDSFREACSTGTFSDYVASLKDEVREKLA
ncbi:MAG: hypothetical protein JKX73_01045, partial [Flavobacteriales bacterium]|nr:hypothetical protein [Flavobacteriales bacterium]